jgi:hypothetical protein
MGNDVSTTYRGVAAVSTVAYGLSHGPLGLAYLAYNHEEITKDIKGLFTNEEIRDMTDTVVTPTYFGDSKRCVALSTVCYMEMVSYQLARKDYLDALVRYIESLINQVS